jgi:hypothetical protein
MGFIDWNNLQFHSGLLPCGIIKEKPNQQRVGFFSLLAKDLKIIPYL